MTLGDKIKNLIHKDKTSDTGESTPYSTGGSNTGATGTGSQTGYGTGTGANTGSNTGYGSGTTANTGSGSNTGSANPLNNSTSNTNTGHGLTSGTGNQSSSGHNTGSGTSGHNTGSGTTGYNTGSGATGAGTGATGAGTGTGSGYGTGSGAGTGTDGRSLGGVGSQTGRFSEGYSQDEPGYSEKFGVGKPQYRENLREGDDGWSADLSASGGTAEWQRARELTEAAEKEAAAAQLSGNEAQRELSAAEQAENAVRKAQAKHREALLEAEKYRERMSDPSQKEAGVADARELYNQKQSLLAEAERSLREAEADLAARKRDHDKLHPQVEQYGQKLPGLEDEYARRHHDREAAEGEKDKYLYKLQQAEKDRSGYAADLDALLAELERAERTASIKQQEYVEARNAAQQYAQQVADLKAKLREADGILSGHRNRANKAEQDLPAYREAEQRALRDLEDSKSEWYRLKELEDEYARSWQQANQRLQSLHGNTDPASKELRDAKGLLASRQDDLDRARQRAVSAEGKYKDLLNLADRHKRYGDSAADAAHQHGEGYEAAKREAHIHGDKHVEYWNEAKTHGESGSTEATSAIKKLEEKVKGLLNREA